MAVRTIALALMIALLAADPRLAAAQRAVGGATRPPEVEVDLSVLDSLGPPPTLPDLLRGQEAAGRSAAASTAAGSVRQTAVHAPRHKKKSKTAARAGTKAPKTVASVAERRAAPVKPIAANSGTATRYDVTATPLQEGAAPAAAPMPELPVPVPPPPPPALSPPPVVSSASPAPPPPGPVAALPEKAPPSAAPPSAPPSPPAAGAAAPPAAPSGAAVVDKVAAATPPPPAQSPPAVTAAAVPSVVTAIGDRTVRVQFPAGAADLPEGAKQDLDGLAQKLASNEQMRLQLIAYAAGSPDEANQARRLSLSRALAVRTYLIAQGVPNSRMDVRALGNRSDGNAPPDRVDIVMLDR